MENIYLIIYSAGLVIAMALLYFLMAYSKTLLSKPNEDPNAYIGAWKDGP